MQTTLVKYEDGFALPLDQSLLDELGIGVETPLHLSVENGRLLVIPLSQIRREKLEAAVKHTMEEYAGVFRRLAES